MDEHQPLPPSASVRPTVSLGEVEDAFESVLSAVLVMDDQGVIVFANTAAVTMFGYSRTQLLGQLVEVLIPEAARQAHVPQREAFLRQPVPRPMAARRHLSAVRADGRTLLVEISLAPLRTTAGVFITAMVNDVTALRAEGELRRILQLRERHLLMSQEVAGMGSWDRYHDTGSVRWSANLFRILGYAPDEVVPGPDAFWSRIHPDDHAVLQHHRTRVLAGDPEIRVEVRLLPALQDLPAHRLGGPQRWVSMLSVTAETNPDGSPLHSIGIVQDITTRKAHEQELLARAARDARIAAILQDGLMPLVPRRVGAVRVAIRYQPAGLGERIGGDWADVFAMPNGRIGLVIGDVAGHGIEVTATMSRLRTLVRLLASSGAGPATVVRRVNHAMHQLDLGDTAAMATLVHAQLEPAIGTLTYASAGHLPLLLLPADDRAGGVEAVATASDPPLGVVEHWPYTEDTVALRPGSIVLGFTDGLVERRREDITVNLRRLMTGLDSLPTHLRTDIEALADTLLALPGDVGTDDVAVVVVSCPPIVLVDLDATGEATATAGLTDLRPPDE